MFILDLIQWIILIENKYLLVSWIIFDERKHFELLMKISELPERKNMGWVVELTLYTCVIQNLNWNLGKTQFISPIICFVNSNKNIFYAFCIIILKYTLCIAKLLIKHVNQVPRSFFPNRYQTADGLIMYHLQVIF